MYRLGKVKLKPFSEEYITNDYKSWFSDPDVTRFNSHGVFPKIEKDFEDFYDSIGSNNIVFAILYPLSDKTTELVHVGNISLQSIDYINRSAEIAIIIGVKRFWGQGIATIACTLILRHAFDKLNLHRVWTGTSSENLGMQKVAENIGMLKEGIFREGKFSNGKYVDIYEYAILKDEYLQIRSERNA